MSFLKAEWRKLAIANFVVNPRFLAQYIPARTELDIWDNHCYVSLVGFMFLDTKLRGLAIPFHRNFEEVNLRFYVRYQEDGRWKRGVVFIKEIVPKHALTLVANLVYRENYQTMKMSHNWAEFEDHRTVEYQWSLNRIKNSFFVKAALEKKKIAENSEAAFITEHYWGYTKVDKNTTFEYEVTHPCWDIYEVFDHQIKVDFGSIYGDQFSELSTIQPVSVMLAEGSKITVENKRKI